jgi:UDP-N-acetyl-2-amino-2-deoxyglucuronate dehydrogenase
MANFAVIGAAGFVAPRHLQAIKDTGSKLIAAVDPHDSVGVLDRFSPECRFFTEIERFDRHLEKLRRRGEEERVHYVTICSPNHLHDSHVRLALRVRANALCEKPLVINPWNLDQLEELETEYEARVYTVLQLRKHPDLIALKERLGVQAAPPGKAEVVLTYVTRRGRWYDVSWKGIPEKSGGVAMNIGIHFFDLLMWLFGEVQETEVHVRETRRMAGRLELQRARVLWFLSVEEEDLPEGYLAEGKHAYRSLAMDGHEIEFSGGFTDLHTRVYESALAGEGYGIADARPSIETVYRIRTDPVAEHPSDAHPLAARLLKRA